jgi:hypothetical protein
MYLHSFCRLLIWNVKTLLANEEDTKERSNNILKDFEELRPIIRNIKLSGEKWLGIEDKEAELRIYDIICHANNMTQRFKFSIVIRYAAKSYRRAFFD